LRKKEKGNNYVNYIRPAAQGQLLCAPSGNGQPPAIFS